MRINVHAGHAAVGKGAIGAVGLISESVEDRKVKDYVIAKLRAQGHTVYDCTVDSGTQSGVLRAIVQKCNSHAVDLDVSIHFNSGANRRVKDGVTTGTEVWVYSANSGCMNHAQRTVEAIAALGFKNRGVKTSKSLYVLARTKAPAMLVECCFVDDGDDVARYNAESMANAIVQGITGVVPAATSPAAQAPAQPSAAPTSGSFLVKTKVNLNVRKGPGISYGITTVAKKNTKFTITEVKGGWGKLKSGAGWINISTAYVSFV